MDIPFWYNVKEHAKVELQTLAHLTALSLWHLHSHTHQKLQENHEVIQDIGNTAQDIGSSVSQVLEVAVDHGVRGAGTVLDETKQVGLKVYNGTRNELRKVHGQLKNSTWREIKQDLKDEV